MATLVLQATGTCPMCDMMAGMGGWGMLLMALFWILLLGLGGWLVYRIVRGVDRKGTPPEEILRERYARGEIDRETYEQMHADLQR